MDCDSCDGDPGNHFIHNSLTAYLRSFSGTGMLFCVYCKLIS